MDIAQVTSLLPRGISNLAAQYFKSNVFNGFCKQVCPLFTFVKMFYPYLIIKGSLPHREVSHLNVFRLLWYSGFLVSLMALVLLMYSTGVFLAKQDNSSDNKCFNQTNSLASSLAAMISASVVERAVFFCSWLVQDIAPSANIAVTHVVERIVTLSPAKSASLNIFSSPDPLVYLRP